MTLNRYLTALITVLFSLTYISCAEDKTNDDDVIIFDDDDDITPTLDDDDSALGAAVTGVVLNAYSQPLSGVEVAMHGVEITTLTDENGNFRLEGIPVSPRAQITFKKSTYARTSTPIEVLEGVENTIIQRMALVDHVFTFNAEDGRVFVADNDLRMELPANNVVDTLNNAYSGAVVAEITYFDLVSPQDEGNELLAVPGDFTAVNSAGEGKVLESYGMIQVNLSTPSGEELQIGGQTAAVRIPVQHLGPPPAAGDEISAWSYDNSNGKWIEEAVGTVIELEGALFWEFQAPHFSTWNCDRPISTHGCLTGTITDSAGSPRGGATVRAVGITYISTTTARTGQDGSFCLEVKNGETVWAEISYSIAGQTATQRTDAVVISPGQASCSLGASTCDDLGTIPVDIQTCIAGIVIDSQNLALEGMQVVSAAGGVATTDAAGAFCTMSPVFRNSDLFVLTEPDNIGFLPVNVFTQPGIPNCQSGCPNMVILRPYESTSCVEGTVLLNGEVAGNVVVEAYDLNFPTTRIYSTLTNTDGSYCIQTPSNVPTAVQVGNSDLPCASETIDADIIGGMACGDIGQTSECYNMNDLVCNL